MMVSAKKLIQGSVIYMKKMRMSKRGFTLTEIIVVVAIIVIVASAAFVGIAVMIQRAKETSAEVERTHGQDDTGKDLFEWQAWDEVDSLTKGMAEFFDIAKYKPVVKDEDNTSTDSNSGDDSSSGSGNAGGNQSGSGVVDTGSGSGVVDTGSGSGIGDDGDDVIPDDDDDDDDVTGIAPASGKSKDGAFYITSTGEHSAHVVDVNNTGDTCDITVIKNADGTYEFSVTAGNRWILANKYKIFEQNGCYFWMLDDTFTITLDSRYDSFFKNTLGLNL